MRLAQSAASRERSRAEEQRRSCFLAGRKIWFTPTWQFRRLGERRKVERKSGKDSGKAVFVHECIFCVLVDRSLLLTRLWNQSLSTVYSIEITLGWCSLKIFGTVGSFYVWLLLFFHCGCIVHCSSKYLHLLMWNTAFSSCAGSLENKQFCWLSLIVCIWRLAHRFTSMDGRKWLLQTPWTKTSRPPFSIHDKLMVFAEMPSFKYKKFPGQTLTLIASRDDFLSPNHWTVLCDATSSPNHALPRIGVVRATFIVETDKIAPTCAVPLRKRGAISLKTCSVSQKCKERDFTDWFWVLLPPQIYWGESEKWRMNSTMSTSQLSEPEPSQSNWKRAPHFDLTGSSFRRHLHKMKRLFWSAV